MLSSRIRKLLVYGCGTTPQYDFIAFPYATGYI